ncbi:uncharacterized protein ARMOST_21287 [Armillaria ostoyae]|uniref:Uncharacterized protein n=1 Tax=Armillaria ostoyae TaxID=47428 RepID=A0A284S9R2_ARMOS|nr:uncharacterized protein ARMOST_21287 [Armillaria ostoyae]
MFLLKVTTLVETYENVARKRHYRLQGDNLRGNPRSSELTTSIAPYQTSVFESAYYSMLFDRYFCSLSSLLPSAYAIKVHFVVLYC